MRHLPGVMHTEAGRANGTSSTTKGDYDGYAECVRTVFNPAQVSVARLMEYIFEIIDPYSVNKQGPDIGEKYRTGAYTANLINIFKKQKHGCDQKKTLNKLGRSLTVK